MYNTIKITQRKEKLKIIMHTIYQKIHDEITDDLNKLMNNFTIRQNEYLDHEIQATISNFLNDFYHINRKIYDYKVNSNYPDVEILIKYSKIYSEIYTIEIQRFERLKKLQKLNYI
jgi:hypothetical protein